MDISCPGPSGSLRFRPTFTLCTNDGLINHIELGEEANSTTQAQKFGDINSLLGFQNLTEFGPTNQVVETSTHRIGCGDCHFKQGSVISGGHTIPLYEDIPPDREILFLNDPNGGPPINVMPLSAVCTGIEASTQLAADPALKDLAVELCNKLELKLR